MEKTWQGYIFGLAFCISDLKRPTERFCDVKKGRKHEVNGGKVKERAVKAMVALSSHIRKLVLAVL